MTRLSTDSSTRVRALWLLYCPHRESEALIGPLSDTLANFPESSEDLIEVSLRLLAHLSLDATQVSKV